MKYITSIFFQSMCLKLKLRIFKKRIDKFRSTNNINYILQKDFSNINILLYALFLSLGFMLLFFVSFVVLTLGIYYFVFLLFKESNRTGSIIALIVGILGVIGVIYSANKKRVDKNKDKYDESILIILKFLIEVKRKNFNYKICKDELSCLFMNIPNNILFILDDIQNNIRKAKNTDKEYEAKMMQYIIDKEVLFLITYIREYYRITDSSFKKDTEHESIINNLIEFNDYIEK